MTYCRCVCIYFILLCGCESHNKANTYVLRNLYPYSKAVGYIKYFCPTEEAKQLDWDKFTIYGIQKIKQAKDSTDFVNQLNTIFQNISPDIKFYYKTSSESLANSDSKNLNADNYTFWQHLGLSIGTLQGVQSIYKSRRIGIDTTGKLFEAKPKPYEFIEKEISLGLYCLFPISLPINNKETNKNAFYALQKELLLVSDTFHIQSSTDLRLANVITTWNVFQHFYPYFEEIQVNWDSVLETTLQKALKCKTEDEYYFLLMEMLAPLQDGHINIRNSVAQKYSGIAARLIEIDGQLIVEENYDIDEALNPGDIILKVDGKDSKDVLKDYEKYISGSNQYKRNRASLNFGYGLAGTQAKLKVKRNDKTFTCEIMRSSIPYNKYRKSFATIAPKVYYVNLSKVDISYIENIITKLSVAEGIIFDLRGYPLNNHGLISYLTDKPVKSSYFMIPQTVYPNREEITYDTSGIWNLQPKVPRLRGKIVFLTDASAMSYSESILSIIKHYKLAIIIGETCTAGANGNVNSFSLPGGYLIRFTGMRVKNQDGSKFHTIGVCPDIEVKRTIQGIKEGRDEVLENAINFINYRQ